MEITIHEEKKWLFHISQEIKRADHGNTLYHPLFTHHSSLPLSSIWMFLLQITDTHSNALCYLKHIISNAKEVAHAQYRHGP